MRWTDKERDKQHNCMEACLACESWQTILVSSTAAIYLKKRGKKMRTFPIPAGNRRLRKKECHSMLLILRWWCFPLGKNFGCLRLQSCLAARESVNIPDFIGFVLQWKVCCVQQTVIYLHFKRNYFPFFELTSRFFLILISAPSLLGCKFPQHVCFCYHPTAVCTSPTLLNAGKWKKVSLAAKGLNGVYLMVHKLKINISWATTLKQTQKYPFKPLPDQSPFGNISHS